MRTTMYVNVVDLIMNDHRELERIFEQVRTQPDQRPTLVPVMITLLTAHSRAEEAEVYPAALEAGIADDVEHSQKEHIEADQLAADVAASDVDAPDFDEKLQKLIDAVTHHVEEEESKVLPGMRQAMSVERLGELGRAFAASRQQHLGERPADVTKAELEQQAANAGISGASSQSKADLSATLQDAAEDE
ncbi:hemerythrin domain-containing protein [Pimelobacter simplex]|nr:hemerythrin domain-containing protein [Pimelobacter simplex]